MFYLAGGVCGPRPAVGSLSEQACACQLFPVAQVAVFVGTTQFSDKGYALSG